MVSVDYYYPPQGSNRPITRRSACPPHPRTDKRRQALALAHHRRRRLHGDARQPRRHERAAEHPRRSRRVDLAARLVRERLHADVRRAAADRRLARRPLRPPARLRRRPRGLHGRLAVGRARDLERHADRRARRAGPRRRARHAAQPDAALGGLPAPSGAASRSASGRASAASPSRSGRSSAAPSSTGSRGSGSSSSTCRSASRSRRSPTASSTRATARTAHSTCAASCSRAPACSRSCGASCAATTRAGRRPRSSASLGLGVALLGAFVAWERRAPAPMLPLHLFRSRAFSATNGVVADHELRHLRLDLPARAVPADRAGLLGLRRGRAHAAVDAHADVHRPARRRVLRSHRQPAADGDRPRPAGDRARLARAACPRRTSPTAA